MNERIRELARLADAGYIPRYDMWQMDTETLNNFAELIVRECGRVAYSEENNYGNKVRFMILEHFGVDK